MVWVRPAVKGMLPEGRAAHTCTLVDNRLVVFGGNDRSQLHSSVWILDIGKFCLFVLAALPGRMCVTPALVCRCPSCVVRHWCVTVRADAWEWVKPTISGTAPSPRAGHTATQHNHLMYVFGGGTGWSGETFNDLYVLDTAALLWYRYVRRLGDTVWRV